MVIQDVLVWEWGIFSVKIKKKKEMLPVASLISLGVQTSYARDTILISSSWAHAKGAELGWKTICFQSEAGIFKINPQSFL